MSRIPDRRSFLRAAFATLATSFGLPKPGQAGTLLRYPYLQNVRTSRVTVCWTTLEPGTASVKIQREGASSRTVSARSSVFSREQTGTQSYYRHAALITGLTPGSDYRYEIFLNDESLVPDEELQFRTIGTVPFQFLVVGDSGDGSAEQDNMAQLMMRERPRFLIHTGDLAYPTGTFGSYERNYFDFYKSMMKRVPFFPTLGNHDYYDTNGIPYLAVHDLPTENVLEADQGRYFSFDWGNAHIICLDSNTPLVNAVSRGGDMLNWLRRDLESSKKFWRIVYFHHPPFGSGPNQNDPLTRLARDYIVPILEEFDVPVVFSGHEHSFQRTHPLRGWQSDRARGTVYYVSGGGGAVLYPVHPSERLAASASVHHYLRCDVNGSEMNIRAVDKYGEVFDQTRIAPRPVLARTNAVVNAASFTRAIARGSLVTIFGRQLAPEELTPQKTPIPKELGNVRVLVNDQATPVLLVSPTQINIQLPYDLLGPASLRVVTPNGSGETQIDVAEVAPALFAAAAFHKDGVQVTADAPAQAGEEIHLYATGLGEVEGAVEPGQPVTGWFPVRAHIAVDLDRSYVDVAWAGLVENMPGVYRVAFRVPAGLAPGMHYVQVTANGVAGNAAEFPTS